jgi:hypothetical protein
VTIIGLAAANEAECEWMRVRHQFGNWPMRAAWRLLHDEQFSTRFRAGTAGSFLQRRLPVEHDRRCHHTEEWSGRLNSN